MSGKSKGGLSKGGLGPKGANWAKKGPFGSISALPPWLWGAEELVPISPEKAPIGPEKVPICPEKARFRRKDFPPIFSENLGLKPPFVSPPLDFPKNAPKSQDRFPPPTPKSIVIPPDPPKYRGESLGAEAVGAVFRLTRFSLVRISIRDLIADRNPY